MSRLIDADALQAELLRMGFFPAMVKAAINRMPTVDAVEVVRCKDCQYRGDDVHCPMCFEQEIEWDDDGYAGVDWILHDRTTGDGFCDRGKRREGDG